MRSFILFAAACLALTTLVAAEKKIVCYYANWAVYDQKFKPDRLDATVCTHFIYAFAVLRNNKITVFDTWADTDPQGHNGYSLFTGLRQRNPSAKFMIAIGGWADSEDGKYTKMAASASSRAQFIDSVVEFLKQYQFDGLDVDWEYPAYQDHYGVSADRNNFVLLLKELKERLSYEGFLLSAAVGATEGRARESYDIAGISQYLDFINLMTYDMQNAHLTSHQAPLKGSLSVESTVDYWLRQGAPKDKLIVGIPAYGRHWNLANPSNNGVGAPVSGPGSAGPISKKQGSLNNYEICDRFFKRGATVYFDEQARVPYAVLGNEWIGFENVQSASEKANYINSLGLGGAMLWRVETDNPNGECEDDNQGFPITRALGSILLHGQSGSNANRPSRPIQPNRPAPRPTNPLRPTHPSRPTNSHQNSWNQRPVPPNNSGVCTQPGFMKDPASCGYIYCQQNFNEIIPLRIACPGDLCYSTATQNCERPE